MATVVSSIKSIKYSILILTGVHLLIKDSIEHQYYGLILIRKGAAPNLYQGSLSWNLKKHSWEDIHILSPNLTFGQSLVWIGIPAYVLREEGKQYSKRQVVL